jgi:hypothetical protein
MREVEYVNQYLAHLRKHRDSTAGKPLAVVTTNKPFVQNNYNSNYNGNNALNNQQRNTHPFVKKPWAMAVNKPSTFTPRPAAGGAGNLQTDKKPDTFWKDNTRHYGMNAQNEDGWDPEEDYEQDADDESGEWDNQDDQNPEDEEDAGASGNQYQLQEELEQYEESYEDDGRGDQQHVGMMRWEEEDDDQQHCDMPCMRAIAAHPAKELVVQPY